MYVFVVVSTPGCLVDDDCLRFVGLCFLFWCLGCVGCGVLV